jgi:hypothetical protein
LNRGGRFGDLCVRVIFTDTPLIDVASAQKNRVKLAVAVGRFVKRPAVKSIPVKKIPAAAAKGSGRQWVKDPKRIEKLLVGTQ